MVYSLVEAQKKALFGQDILSNGSIRLAARSGNSAESLFYDRTKTEYMVLLVCGYNQGDLVQGIDTSTGQTQCIGWEPMFFPTCVSQQKHE